MRTRTASLLRPLALALTALLLIGATAAFASSAGKTKRYASHVSLKLTDSQSKRLQTRFAFEGNVRSKINRCERGRRIELTRKTPMESEPWGEANTNNNGHYKIAQQEPPPSGRYTAEVLREKNGNKVCKGATSKPFVVPPL